MSRKSAACLVLFCVFPFVAASENPAVPPLIPREREMALAMSAGPPGIVNNATLYVLERGTGFIVARKGTNGFACLVNRDRPDTLEPECYDPEGVNTIMPVAMERARLREQGIEEEAISLKIADGYRNGTYRAPARSGVTYMLSTENRVFNGREVISYPPHVMIAAPYVKNSDIGSDFKDPNMPWVLNEGSPHAYIMILVRDPTEKSKKDGSGKHEH